MECIKGVNEALRRLLVFKQMPFHINSLLANLKFENINEEVRNLLNHRLLHFNYDNWRYYIMIRYPLAQKAKSFE